MLLDTEDGLDQRLNLERAVFIGAALGYSEVFDNTQFLVYSSYVSDQFKQTIDWEEAAQLENADFISYVYNRLLLRVPEPSRPIEVSVLLNSGMSRHDYVDSILASAEYCDLARKFPRRASPVFDWDGIIELDADTLSAYLYNQILGRPVGSIEQLEIKKTLGRSGSIASVVNDLLSSDEFRSSGRVWSSVLNWSIADRLSNTEFVAYAYRAVLSRPVDSCGLVGHVAYLKNGGCREQVLYNIIDSDEGRATELIVSPVLDERLALFFSDDDFLEKVYLQVLDRKPTIKELSNHLSSLKSGASRSQVVRCIVASKEFRTSGRAIGVEKKDVSSVDIRSFSQIWRRLSKRLLRRKQIKAS